MPIKFKPRRKIRVAKKKTAAPLAKLRSGAVKIATGSTGLVRIPRQTGFPTHMNATLIYNSGKISMTCSSGVIAGHLFNVNNIFDPDRTGVGLQPMAHDQYTSIYARYRVMAVDYTVSASNSTDNQPISMYVGYNQNTAFPNVVSESKGYVGTVGGANGQVVNMKGSVTAWKAAGVTRAQYLAGDNYQALTGAAPVLQSTLALFVQPFDESTTTIMYTKWNVTYHVRFFSPKFLGSS